VSASPGSPPAQVRYARSKAAVNAPDQGQWNPSAAVVAGAHVGTGDAVPTFFSFLREAASLAAYALSTESDCSPSCSAFASSGGAGVSARNSDLTADGYGSHCLSTHCSHGRALGVHLQKRGLIGRAGPSGLAAPMLAASHTAPRPVSTAAPCQRSVSPGTCPRPHRRHRNVAAGTSLSPLLPAKPTSPVTTIARAGLWPPVAQASAHTASRKHASCARTASSAHFAAAMIVFPSL